MKYLILLWILCCPAATANKVLPPADYLSKKPWLDGVLDEALKSLPIRRFENHYTLDNPPVSEVEVSYRLAYTATHLYLFIETDAEQLNYHKRGHLWGDGFKVLVGKPTEEGVSQEYYELAFSPGDEGYLHQFMASYNFDSRTRNLSEDTQFAEALTNTGSGFEVLIAWDDIYPYHPFFDPSIGINIYFAKGFDTDEHGYFPHGHSIVHDEGIWDEEIAQRAHRILPFEPSKEAQQNKMAMRLARSHIFRGEPLTLNIAGQILNAQQAYELDIINAQSELVLTEHYNVVKKGVLSRDTLTILTKEMPAGEYRIVLKDNEQVFQTLPLSILPEIDICHMDNTIASFNKESLSTGTINTLRFKLLSLKAAIGSLAYYETAEDAAKQYDVLSEEILKASENKDPYTLLGQKVPYRRAFKSSIDQSYQPYSIKLPVSYDPVKKYPLLVFLHGSGTDEQRLLNRERGDGRFIELAPFARDKYRAYSSALSQKDITDAIDDVIAHFSVDQKNIVIGGFSMGGYGALRAFYENPTLYRGIAVFAGHPNLANEWLDGGYPNFLESPYIDRLNDKPIFIYHGTSDPAVPFDLMELLANKVRQNGGNVTASFVPERGHVYQDKTTHEQYKMWLKTLIQVD